MFIKNVRQLLLGSIETYEDKNDESIEKDR